MIKSIYEFLKAMLITVEVSPTTFLVANCNEITRKILSMLNILDLDIYNLLYRF